MFGNKNEESTSTPKAESYTDAKGFKSLPLKEQYLVHAIYAAVGQAIKENAS